MFLIGYLYPIELASKFYISSRTECLHTIVQCTKYIATYEVHYMNLSKQNSKFYISSRTECLHST